VEASLRRLNVEVIDLYQIHWPHPAEDLEEGWAAIADLIREGKVRYAGASNFSVEQLRRVQVIHPVASLQPPYSMLDRRIEQDLLPFCADNDIGVVIYSPMQSGLLTGKFTRAVIEGLEPGDWRLHQPQFREPQLTANLAFIDELRTIAAHHDRPLAQLAIAWTLRRPEVTSAIVGARRPGQIQESAPAGDWTLPGELLAEIERRYRACYGDE
jgi:aryl-alcohol dehydrogenase-like predicted oxidoreductase